MVNILNNKGHWAGPHYTIPKSLRLLKASINTQQWQPLEQRRGIEILENELPWIPNEINFDKNSGGVQRAIEHTV